MNYKEFDIKKRKRILKKEKKILFYLIEIIICIMSLFMLYLTFIIDLPEYYYFCKNPNIKINTLFYFRLIYISGFLVNLIALILYRVD